MMFIKMTNKTLHMQAAHKLQFDKRSSASSSQTKAKKLTSY